MLTYEDCLELAELTEEEVESIAQHEHIPEIVALEYGHYLIESPDGIPMLKRIILDDIKEQRQRGHIVKALHLKLVLRHFVHSHPLHPEKT